MPGECCHRQLRSLLSCLCDVFQVPVNSLVFWCQPKSLQTLLCCVAGGPMVSSGSQAGYPQGGASGSSYPPPSGAMPQGGSAGASYPRPQMGQQGQPGRKPGVSPVSHVRVYARACVHVPQRAMCTLSLRTCACVCVCVHACVCAHVVINLLVCLNCSLLHMLLLTC